MVLSLCVFFIVCGGPRDFNFSIRRQGQMGIRDGGWCVCQVDAAGIILSRLAHLGGAILHEKNNAQMTMRIHESRRRRMNDEHTLQQREQQGTVAAA